MAAYLEFEDKIKKIEDDIIIAKTKADEHAVEILERKNGFIKVLGLDNDFIGWIKDESFDTN